jgi:hypothetical protein
MKSHSQWRKAVLRDAALLGDVVHAPPSQWAVTQKGASCLQEVVVKTGEAAHRLAAAWGGPLAQHPESLDPSLHGEAQIAVPLGGGLFRLKAGYTLPNLALEGLIPKPFQTRNSTMTTPTSVESEDHVLAQMAAAVKDILKGLKVRKDQVHLSGLKFNIKRDNLVTAQAVLEYSMLGSNLKVKANMSATLEVDRSDRYPFQMKFVFRTKDGGEVRADNEWPSPWAPSVAVNWGLSRFPAALETLWAQIHGSPNLPVYHRGALEDKLWAKVNADIVEAGPDRNGDWKMIVEVSSEDAADLSRLERALQNLTPFRLDDRESVSKILKYVYVDEGGGEPQANGSYRVAVSLES